MRIEKHLAKKLPKVVQDPDDRVYADYVLSVLAGTKKGEALKEHFPDRYERAIERAGGNTSLHASNIMKEVRQVERSKICKKLYEEAHKSWWIQFLEKKNKLYDNLYSMALDENINARERVSASKVMLEHMPTFQEDINVKVEVKQSKEDFVEHLRSMQISLQKQALSSTGTDDAIEVEVE